jgi:hypothetical protein
VAGNLFVTVLTAERGGAQSFKDLATRARIVRLNATHREFFNTIGQKRTNHGALSVAMAIWTGDAFCSRVVGQSHKVAAAVHHVRQVGFLNDEYCIRHSLGDPLMFNKPLRI